MEMTNFGCAQLERMNQTKIEERIAFLSRHVAGREAKMREVKAEIADDKKALRQLAKDLANTIARKAQHESNSLA
jgi:uncharacterized coiled-coil protein SlyX